MAIKKTFVDISGLGNSGKTAISDYLKQYETIFSFPNYVEFEIFRVAGGVLDLYFAIYESWNLIRSTVRINEFEKLIERIGKVQTASNPGTYFTASGHNYDSYFNGRFREISHNLVQKVITGKQHTFWPYENLRLSPMRVFHNKFKSKFFNKLVSADIYFSNRNDFLNHVATYMQELFSEAASAAHSHVLLNNAFDAYNPSLCIQMVGDAYSIIVERDPRDIYASQMNQVDKYVPDFEKVKNAEKIKRQMLGFDSIDQFIFRYKTIKNNISGVNESRVLRIRYEDFLLDHDNQAEKIKSFIGIPKNAKIQSNGFDVNNSKRNVGLWWKFADTPEIKLIHKELADYCYQS